MLIEQENNGARFRDHGQQADLLTILDTNGFNTIRLRLWVNPFDLDTDEPFLGGTNDIGATIALGLRAKAAGMKIILDFHYSDFWADPKKQSKPRAWAQLAGQDLEEAVYSHTHAALTALADHGIRPDYVQVGNEITNGMLWPDGRTTQFIWEEQRFAEHSASDHAAGFDNLARLLRRGCDATREVCPEAKIILHLDNGGSNLLYRVWFDEISARKIDFDVIGLSYYPFWHGTLEQLEANLQDLASRYKKDLLVVETGYPYRMTGRDGEHVVFGDTSPMLEGFPVSPEGQQAFLMELAAVVRRTPEGRGIGIVYWEPQWYPVDGVSWASGAGMAYGDDVCAEGNIWANLVLFDFDGNALPGLAAFGEM